MTTTDLEPAALRALHEAAKQEVDDIQYYGGPTSAHYTPKQDALIAYLRNAVPNILALIEERDRLRGALEKIAKQDYGYQAVIESGAPPEKHADYFCSMVNWRRHVARAALAGEQP